MIVHRSIAAPPPQPESWDERWGDIERALVCCWLRGIDKAKESPQLAAAAARGELPPLVWRGGVGRQTKALHKIGSLNYLATWQGLRQEDLSVDPGSTPRWTCTRFGVTVTFTGDVARLLSAGAAEDFDEEDDLEPLHQTGGGLQE